MRNEILIPSAIVPNIYYLGPMGDPDPSNFINKETNCQRNMVGSLPRAVPKVVDCRQTGVQAMNKMMMQDRHEVLSRFGCREGVIPTSCV